MEDNVTPAAHYTPYRLHIVLCCTGPESMRFSDYVRFILVDFTSPLWAVPFAINKYGVA